MPRSNEIVAIDANALPWKNVQRTPGPHTVEPDSRTRTQACGGFVWYPEGCVMEHGATAEADVTVVLSRTSRSTFPISEPTLPLFHLLYE